jgi:hypothetical protein
MDTEQAWKTKVRRTARIARIIDGLERLDETALENVERLVSQHPARVEERRPVPATRRDFLRAAAAGGAVVAVTGGLAAWQLGYGRAAAVQTEINSLRRLVGLYEQMDQVGLDDRLGSARQAIGGLIAGLRGAAESLRSGLEAGRSALLDFETSFPSLQAALQWLQQNTATLSQRLLAMENSLNGLLGITGPLAETVGGFLSWLLGQLPSSAANQARDGLERTGETVSVLPGLLEGLHTRILEPMAEWFSPHSPNGLTQRLVNVLVAGVLDPSAALVDQVVQLTTAWEEQWLSPLEQALEERARIRAQIERHQESRGL